MTIKSENITKAGRHVPVSIWRYEIEAAVDSGVFDVVSIQAGLILVELLKLLLHIGRNRLPASHSQTHSPVLAAE